MSAGRITLRTTRANASRPAIGLAMAGGAQVNNSEERSFLTSFGYFDPYMLRVALKYPNVEFRHQGLLWDPDQSPKNTGSYFGYIGEAIYVCGFTTDEALLHELVHAAFIVQGRLTTDRVNRGFLDESE